ncbi:hypothetical protein OKW21_005055 [Catalinimonas alkaloidigena]|uniref:hypothetical protein n=1 Tax=Catalinimonas alkaloidigena TaxID=1075417 RepID=UPI002404F8D1|nr:hypothetical protein [Catalinimonas alkaloidigena]MDF9799792.1 hypothetical protein [Catalinimonas alkaloidigena]
MGISIAFILMSLMLFLSPYFDAIVGISGSFIFLMGAGFLWGIDYAFSTITFEHDKLKLRGYFSMRRLDITYSDVEGFMLEESSDQLSGYHFRVCLILKSGKKIGLAKMAYSNYETLVALIESKFELLEIKRHLFAKWMPIIWFLSGVLALLVAMMKILK